jgi:hypothetical protein
MTRVLSQKERERGADEYHYTKTNAVAQKEKDGRKMRVGEEEEEEELGKTEKPKGQSAEAVEPAADGRSHHRTLQRQTAGAEGLHEAGCHFRADNECRRV